MSVDIVSDVKSRLLSPPLLSIEKNVEEKKFKIEARDIVLRSFIKEDQLGSS